MHEAAHQRLQTSDLNKLLKYAFGKRPPPVYRGAPIKMYFATQIETAPPTIVIFVNYPQRINFSYERYLRNAIRDQFPFVGSDIRIQFRKRTDKAQKESGEE